MHSASECRPNVISFKQLNLNLRAEDVRLCVRHNSSAEGLLDVFARDVLCEPAQGIYIHLRVYSPVCECASVFVVCLLLLLCVCVCACVCVCTRPDTQAYMFVCLYVCSHVCV